jgi:hypothetical protein
MFFIYENGAARDSCMNKTTANNFDNLIGIGVSSTYDLTRLPTSNGLVFDVLPTIDKECHFLHDDYFNGQKNSDYYIYVEHSVYCTGSMQSFKNWTDSLLLKYIFGFYYDLSQMYMTHSTYLLDCHPGNIFYDDTIPNDIRFYWADPGVSTMSNKHNNSDVSKYFKENFIETNLRMLEENSNPNTTLLAFKAIRHRHDRNLVAYPNDVGSYLKAMTEDVYTIIQLMPSSIYDEFVNITHPIAVFTKMTYTERLNKIEMEAEKKAKEFDEFKMEAEKKAKEFDKKVERLENILRGRIEMNEL